jgi:hypothetical protein
MVNNMATIKGPAGAFNTRVKRFYVPGVVIAQKCV